jgi:hypothetical protein
MIEAPLSQWMVKETYPTAADCEEVVHRTDPNTPIVVIGPFAIQSRLCISTADPRLHQSETTGGVKP